LGDGERDCIELCGQVGEVEALVTDDYLAFVTATRLGLKVWMLPVIELAERGNLMAEVARVVREKIRSRDRGGIIEHSLVCLKDVKKSGENCGAREGRNSAGRGATQGERDE